MSNSVASLAKHLQHQFHVLLSAKEVAVAHIRGE